MNKSILFVGSNPSQASTMNSAFEHNTKSWATVTKWIDQVGIAVSCFENVSNIKTPNNRPLNKQEIKDGVQELQAKIDWHKFTHIVTLGQTADKALSLYGIKHLDMPHPSGLNRKLNDPKYVEEQIQRLKEYWDGPG